MQGACVFGMTAALYSGITLENGAVVESNFHDYEMVRADAFPQVVHTHIVEHPFAVHATGVGEPGVPPFLPALTNAIFNATGKRISNLPIRDQLATCDDNADETLLSSRDLFPGHTSRCMQRRRSIIASVPAIRPTEKPPQDKKSS